MTPPTYVKALPKLEFDEIDTPLRQALEFYEHVIQQDVDAGRLQPPDAWLSLNTYVAVARQDYRSVLVLLDPERKKTLPVQATIVARALLEAVGNVMAILEAPQERMRILNREAFRNALETHHRYLEDFGGDPNNAAFLTMSAAWMEKWADELAITQAERAEPSLINEYWPSPGKMLIKNPAWITGSAHQVFKFLYDRSYSSMSEVAHQKAAVLAFARLADNPAEQWNPGMAESNIVANAILFVAILLSEIEHGGGFPRNRDLNTVWACLQRVDLHALKLWKLRYEHL